MRWRLKLYREEQFLMEVGTEFHVAGELLLKVLSNASQEHKYHTTFTYIHRVFILVIVPKPYLVLFRTGTRSIRSGSRTFFVLEPDHAKYFRQVFTV